MYKIYLSIFSIIKRAENYLIRFPVTLGALLIVIFAVYQIATQFPALFYWPALEREIVSRHIQDDEANYLFSMRDTHLGCKTIRYRTPDILFVGDSHSYAGYDYEYLQRILKKHVVGNCALAGMFPINLSHLISSTVESSLSPKYIVFGIQPRMFWDVKVRSNRVERARKEIFAISRPKESLVKLLQNKLSVLDKIYDGPKINQAQIKQDGILKGMPVDVFDAFLAQPAAQKLPPLIYWKEAVNNKTIYTGMPEVIDNICTQLNRSNIKLAIVYIPESRWLNQIYTNGQRANFIKTAMLFKQCADWIDLKFLKQYGGENRWFANRYLLDDYPYEAWHDPLKALKWVEEKPKERRWQFFDPDHMNSYGAKNFSIYMADKIRDWVDNTSPSPAK